MSGHGTYSEESFVEQPAIQLFAEMVWQAVSRMDFRHTRNVLLLPLLSGLVVIQLRVS